jgi:nitroreductase
MSRSLFEALDQITSQRKSVRHFSDRKIPQVLIDQIISIAGRSPYASGRKNWGIEIITDRSVIGNAAAAVDDHVKALSETVRESYRDQFESYALNFSAFRTAPAILVPCYRVSPSLSALIESPDNSLLTWERDNVIKSISCVTMLLLLAAESVGVSACCITGALIAEKKLSELFRIKNGRQIGALVSIGFESSEE